MLLSGQQEELSGPLGAAELGALTHALQ